MIVPQKRCVIKESNKIAAFERLVSWVSQIVLVQVSHFQIYSHFLFFTGVPTLLFLEILRCSWFFGKCCGLFSSVPGFWGIFECEALLNTFEILKVKII